MFTGWCAMPFVEKDDVRLFYRIDGDGKPIVLIHGAWSNHSWWRPIIDLLSKRYMTVAVDVRGHGNSTKLEKPFSVEGFAEDLHFMLEELGFVEVVLMGHSMGGMISMQYALDHPERVRGLVLVATTPRPGRHLKYHLFYYLAKLKLISYEKILVKTLRKMFHPSTPSETVEWAIKELLKTSKEDFIKILKTVEKFDITHRLDEIKQPALIIVGERDSLTPPEKSQLLNSKIPNSRLVFIEECDHTLILDKPERIVDETTKFLEEINY